METFLDGGLFEILIAISFAIFLNFIFLRKYLLILFSLLIIACPLLLFFVKRNEIYYWLVGFCFLNAILLVVLLWKEKRKNAAGPLFDVQSMKNKFAEIGNNLRTFFKLNK
jgi:hypothetical protein